MHYFINVLFFWNALSSLSLSLSLSISLFFSLFLSLLFASSSFPGQLWPLYLRCPLDIRLRMGRPVQSESVVCISLPAHPDAALLLRALCCSLTLTFYSLILSYNESHCSHQEFAPATFGHHSRRVFILQQGDFKGPHTCATLKQTDSCCVLMNVCVCVSWLMAITLP